MSEQKRKPKRSKAMRVTTEATKAKLPRPKRKRPPGSAPDVTPSPIAGQSLDGIGSVPAPEVRAIPCGDDVIGLTFDGDDGRIYTIQKQGIGVKWMPAKPLEPWPVRWGLAVTRWVERLAARFG